MKRKNTLNLAALSLAMLSAYSFNAQADTLFVRANGYTLNAKQQLQSFDAMLVNDAGKVIGTGTQKQLQKKMPKAKLIDLGGKTVLPGLIDAHGHVFNLGTAESQLSLRATNTLQEALAAISQYAKQATQQQWILGGEWNQAIWKLGRFPTAKELDAVVVDRPVWLRRVDGHARPRANRPRSGQRQVPLRPACRPP